jgi:hypothetical protein
MDNSCYAAREAGTISKELELVVEYLGGRAVEIDIAPFRSWMLAARNYPINYA